MTELALVHEQTYEQIQSAREATFDDFWTLWPRERRLEKKAARGQWNKLTHEQHIAALVALVGWGRVWAKQEAEYIVYPHRWLRGERWEDELPADYQRPTHASHVLAKPGVEAERGPIPAHVLAALERLRK